MARDKVLARINLDAILSNLEILAAEDHESASLAARWNGCIAFKVGTRGPRTTLTFSDGAISVRAGVADTSGIVLFFPSERMLNNMFSGEGIGFPLPLKGLIKIKGLLTFMKLAQRMEKILKGDNPPLELKAKLMLNTIARTMAVVANHDEALKPSAAELRGTAELRIKDGYAVHVKFGGPVVSGHRGAAPDPDLIMEFKNSQFFLDLADDKVDTMAAICLEDMHLTGDLHMGDIVNGFLDKIGEYLA